MIRIVNSKLFCGTAQIPFENSTNSTDIKSSIKLFKIRLPNFYDIVSRLENYLTCEELQRAQRYHFEKDKNRFIICRSILKFLLSEHIGIAISEIRIDIHSNKKPYLASHPSVFFEPTKHF